MPSRLLAEAVLRASVRRGWIQPATAERILPRLAGCPRNGLEAALRDAGCSIIASHLGGLLPPPQLPAFGRWTPLAHLGGGAMGKVWLAAAAEGPLVVVKTAAGTASAAPLVDAAGSVWMGGGAAQPMRLPGSELAQRFAREVALTSALAHPRIVPCLGGGVAGDGTRYLALQWIPDGDLAARLERDGPLSVAATLAVIDQLADALACAHARGVIHRDVKPGNIFVHDDGAVLLGDFGLARPTAAEATRLTMAGVAVGTPAAMAPEQIAGTGAVDARSDLYGLGCLIFSCLAGRPPFSGRSTEVMHAHRTRPAPDLATVVPGTPPGLAALVARLLAKRPEDRPGSAEEVRRQLAPLLAAAGIGPGATIPFARAGAPAALPAALLTSRDGAVAVALWASDRIVLGKHRSAGVDLVVREYPEAEHRARIARISRRHCAVALDATGVATVEDLASANGTCVDDQALLSGGRCVLDRPRHRLGLAGASTLELLPCPGGIVIRRPENRPGLAYAVVARRLSLGSPDSELPLAGAGRQIVITRIGEGLMSDGKPLRIGQELDLDGFRLHVQALGDWL